MYIAGSGRSGSTLLDLVLGQLPGWWSNGELTKIWYRGWVRDHLCTCGEPVSRCPHWCGVHERLVAQIGKVDPLHIRSLRRATLRLRYLPGLLTAPRTAVSKVVREELRTVHGALYDAIAEVTEAEVLVDSSKDGLYGLLLADIPNIELHVVHLVRDSRAVAYSRTRRKRLPDVTDRVAWNFRSTPVKSSIAWDVDNMVVELLRTRARSSIRLRYEDFMESPAQTVAEIAGLVGAKPPPSFITEEGFRLSHQPHGVGGNPMRFDVNAGATRFEFDDEWTRKFKQVRRTTALTLPLLRRYGY